MLVYFLVGACKSHVIHRMPSSPFSHQMTDTAQYTVYTDNLNFQYPESSKLGLNNINLHLKPGEKFLLVGPNGAGKSTLLKVLAGKKLINSGSVSLFGINPFDLRNNSALNSKNIVYLGTEWANNEITKRDIGVNELIKSVGGEYYIDRRDRLIDLLEINTTWRMNRCSDGERRRVQLCMGLLKPFDLLLLDEVTIDLDVLVRQKLLDFLYDETISRGCSIIYATHIFDGLGKWPDHVYHLKDGGIHEHFTRENIQYVNNQDPAVATTALQSFDATNPVSVLVAKVSSLYPVALEWLRRDRGH